jgi:general secretion pathway protein G
MTQRRNTRRARGFTLIEILVVVLIIGLLVSVVGPNVWNTFIRSQKGVAKAQIENLKTALEQYRLNLNRYPDTLDELLQPDPTTGRPWLDRKSVPLDPWGNEYFYTVEADGSYVITCFGADGAPGGEGENADLSSEEE